MNQNLQQLMGGLGNALQNQPFGYYPVADNRTDRERLLDKLANNCNMIGQLEKQNEEIKEAIKLLDEHPLIERLSNLKIKLLGR